MHLSGAATRARLASRKYNVSVDASPPESEERLRQWRCFLQLLSSYIVTPHRSRNDPGGTDAATEQNGCVGHGHYAESARQTLQTAGDAAKRVVDSFRSGFGRPGN